MLLFVQILFFLSFIVIFPEPFHITIWSLPSDKHNWTLHQIITGYVYVPFLILTHYPRSRDVVSFTINLIRCCFILLVICRMLLMLAGDIEPNPGPKPSRKLSFAVWNLNSLLARDGSNISIIESLQDISSFHLFGVLILVE